MRDRRQIQRQIDIVNISCVWVWGQRGEGGLAWLILQSRTGSPKRLHLAMIVLRQKKYRDITVRYDVFSVAREDKR